METLATDARNAHIVDGLEHNLSIVGKLCDAGLTAYFLKNMVEIKNETDVVLTSRRDHQNGMWNIPLQQNEYCNLIYNCQRAWNMIKFMYAALGSPSISTLKKGIEKGYFKSWPGLTAKVIDTHIQYSDASVKDHMDQVRKNIKGTKHDVSEIKNDNISQEKKRINSSCPFQT